MRAFLLAAILGVAVLGFAGAGAAQAHGPGGVYAGYGNGPHDYLPHHHSVSPWGGVRSYSPTPFGPTKSYNGFPYSDGYYGGGLYGGGYYGGYYGPWAW